MKYIIGLVGMPGSGKSTALEIAKQFGEVVVMGDVVREEAKNRNIPINSQNLGQLAKSLRNQYGPDAIAQKCIQKMQSITNDFCFLDGIRSKHEMTVFAEKYLIKVVAIIVPDHIRHQWLISRNRQDDSSSIDDILERDKRELDFGVQTVIENADFQIENLGTIEELKLNCEKTFKELIFNDFS
ncbi:AAA family ATPase [Candidatus Lokiarchaeum ossiferum]